MNMSKTIQTTLALIIFNLLLSSIKAQRALLFGASGQVGFEVYKGLIQSPFWEEVILIGRSFPSKLDEYQQEEEQQEEQHTTRTDDSKNERNVPKVTKKAFLSLRNIDKDEQLVNDIKKADACFIAIGVPNPQETTLEYWYSVEVDMISSISKLCNDLQVQLISLLSTTDAEEDPTPFSSDELQFDAVDDDDDDHYLEDDDYYKDDEDVEKDTKKETENILGWMGMIKLYFRMKGLEEQATIKASATSITTTNAPPSVHLFQPSTIVTQEYRYGWVDWVIFRLHKVFDPIIPTKYHSVPCELLGMAMVKDAEQVLSSSPTVFDDVATVKRLTYSDFLQLAAEEYSEKFETNVDAIKEEM